jgi:hypothetical protein
MHLGNEILYILNSEDDLVDVWHRNARSLLLPSGYRIFDRSESLDFHERYCALATGDDAAWGLRTEVVPLLERDTAIFGSVRGFPASSAPVFWFSVPDQRHLAVIDCSWDWLLDYLSRPIEVVDVFPPHFFDDTLAGDIWPENCG